MEYIDTNGMLKEYNEGFSYYKFLKTGEKIAVVICSVLLIYSCALLNYWLEKSYKNSFIIFLTVYIVTLILIGLTSYKINFRLRKSINLKNHDMSTDDVIRIIRGRCFINYLEKECLINTMKQKEKLVEILTHDMEKYNIKSFWIVGGMITLSIPLWNKYISSSNLNWDMIKETIYLIIFILGVAASIKYVVVNNLLLFFNRKYRRYQDMIYIIKQDLVLNHYNKKDSIDKLLEFHGIN